MNKRVLVTGSSRGIGKAIALKLASQGYDITVHCRSGIDAANDTAEKIKALGRNVSVLQFDVCDREAAEQQICEDIAQFGHYYGVVCNAGITRDMAFPAMTGEDWDVVVKTGLEGFYNVVKPTVMPMVQSRQGGRIITMASVSGMIGNRGQVNYSAAKAGIIGATKALALELAKRKICVNCVAPGLIDTDMTEDVPIEQMLKMIPLKRAGNVQEVAGTVSFLMSDDAAYITRQVISVNGGIA
ncbi:3-oxoacyl-ACP reductase FabG [Thalassotalea litorea]|uniref:3-oxoacyl-ACP reductase FabG n=1 Tax=Thalassotalea litorea TaxID=2020715 RepID=UPI00373521B4